MKPIHTDKAPAAVGPYSQAMVCDGWLYVSGQVALEPGSGEMIGSDAPTQASQLFRNLGAILAEAGTEPSAVVRATVYLTDMADFASVNELYAQFFGEHRPARACVAVSGLPKGALVEIDVIARIV